MITPFRWEDNDDTVNISFMADKINEIVEELNILSMMLEHEFFSDLRARTIKELDDINYHRRNR